MKSRLAVVGVASLVLCVGGVAWAQPPSVPDPGGMAVMPLDPEMYQEHMRQLLSLPRAEVPAEKDTYPPTLNLLPHFVYDPAERNQGDCGNCWIWSGAALLQFQLNYHHGVQDELSNQFFTSCYFDHFACMGGTPGIFFAHCEEMGYALASSNYNAHYQQFGTDYENMLPAVDCEDISHAPRHLMRNFQVEVLPTFVELEEGYASAGADAVAAIKAKLNAGQFVILAYYMPTQETLDEFRTHWLDAGEDTYIDLSAWHGLTWTEQGSGHAVVLVGYTEDAWLVLNSWSTTPNRPNGLFTMGPIDSMNYGAWSDADGRAQLNMIFASGSFTYEGMDTDGDMVSDQVEIKEGTDPLDAGDTPALPLPWPGLAAALAAAGVAALRRLPGRASLPRG